MAKELKKHCSMDEYLEYLDSLSPEEAKEQAVKSFQHMGLLDENGEETEHWKGFFAGFGEFIKKEREREERERKNI
jgi:hypothetical protein